MRQTGVVITRGNDAFHHSEQNGCTRGEEGGEEGEEEGPGVHLTYHWTVGQQVFLQRGGCRSNRACLLQGHSQMHFI